MFHERIYYPGKDKVYLECFVLDSGLRLGQDVSRPAVVICPGGGYVYLSPREAEPVAASYLAKGIHAFVLNYSLGWDAVGFEPLKELEWAINLIRERSGEWNVAPGKIFAAGFSAGGHLALSCGLLGRVRPDGLILGYPAVSLEGPGTKALGQLLLGKEMRPEVMDLTRAVTKDAPPLFLFTTAEDTLTCRASIDLVKAYSDLGLACEFHLFQKGLHGYSLADSAAADGSSQVLNKAVAEWFGLSVEWLFSVSGPLEFKDYSTSRMGDELRKLGLSLGETPGNA